ncbi:hypothetical protein COU61_01195 [Candidatus Pacearchaeota archaeon CG10_big_fil_rev_8_21_14_0_10_35_13]|nr:MAG: hypothetical protein COU61_01195 [Candidatus Pacearchaeota archaeon CG10_big_fil_rev_8_21_14_0_10_35_13]
MVVKKKGVTKRVVRSNRGGYSNAYHLEHLNTVLVENFTGLQRVMTNLSVKFDALTGQVSKLLSLFELSAKSFAEKQIQGGTDIQKDAEFLQKLNTLLEQNKTIAKGLTFMGENIRERVYGPGAHNDTPPAPSGREFRPIPRGVNPSMYHESYGSDNKSQETNTS